MQLKNVFRFSSLLTFALALITVASCQNNSGTGKLTAKEFSDKIQSTTNAAILDVRTPGEFSEGFINGAVNIDYNNENFKESVNKLDKSKTYFVYCLAGGRSSGAADYMRSNGFTNVFDMKGGINAWRQATLPLVTANTITSADKISADEFAKLISDSLTVLIDFYAPWCGPCKKMKPFLEEIEKEQAGKVKVIRINIGENKNLSDKLGITELPVVMVYQKGERKMRHDGFADKQQLLKMIE